VSVEKCSIH